VSAVRRTVIELLRRTAAGRRLEFLLRRWRAGQRRRQHIPDACMPSMPGPPYPPYHRGPTLEECFFTYARGRAFAREYIPVFWTAAYARGEAGPIQPALLSLSPSRRYFTVCQHDLAPQEILPPDTLVFAAGGLYRGPGLIPIPLVGSRLRDPIEPKPKEVFCSFVGSQTHRIRRELWEAYRGDPAFRFEVSDRWTADVPPARAELFVQLTERSRFTLCPRGFGPTSFRLYEAMQLGSVPVYVSDRHHLPWTDELAWDDLAVLVRPEEIPSLGERLRAINEAAYHRMLANIRRVYDDYFSLAGVCRQIERRVV
jgi:hypothetical protein